MKDLRNLKGAKELNKKEQKLIKGGVICRDCPPISDCCVGGECGKYGWTGECLLI